MRSPIRGFLTGFRVHVPNRGYFTDVRVQIPPRPRETTAVRVLKTEHRAASLIYPGGATATGPPMSAARARILLLCVSAGATPPLRVPAEVARGDRIRSVLSSVKPNGCVFIRIQFLCHDLGCNDDGTGRPGAAQRFNSCTATHLTAIDFLEFLSPGPARDATRRARLIASDDLCW